MAEQVTTGFILPGGLVGIALGTCFGARLHFEVFDRGVRQNLLAYLP